MTEDVPQTAAPIPECHDGRQQRQSPTVAEKGWDRREDTEIRLPFLCPFATAKQHGLRG